MEEDDDDSEAQDEIDRSQTSALGNIQDDKAKQPAGILKKDEKGTFRKKKSSIVPADQHTVSFDPEQSRYGYQPQLSAEHSKANATVRDVRMTDPNEYSFMLLGERYFTGRDARFIEQFDEEKFAVGLYGEAEIYVLDREQPEIINQFSCFKGSNVNLTLQLLPMFNYYSFPFAFVLS